MRLNNSQTKYEDAVRTALNQTGNRTEADAYIYAYLIDQFLEKVQTATKGHFVYTNQLHGVIKDLLKINEVK